MNAIDNAPELQAALAAVADAGAIALEYFRQPMAVTNKLAGGSAFDPVTEADRRIEALIRERLGQRFPDHAIVGEEYGTSGAGENYWIIDPIDGTRAFISGMPSWGILLGLVESGRPTLGLLHQPFTGETFFADAAGSWLRRGGSEIRLATRAGATLADAVLYTTHPSMITGAGLEAQYAELTARCRLQRWGGDCYGFALLAHGCIDLMIDALLQPYDIVPLIPIIEGAGGIVTDLDGRLPLAGGTVVAAANPALHAEALAILRGQAR